MTPAIVVGSGLGALGTLRLLRRAGIPAYSLPSVASIDFRALAQTVGAQYVAADATFGCVRECARSSGVMLIEVAVSDGAALSGAALMRRAKALAGSAPWAPHGGGARAWLR